MRSDDWTIDQHAANKLFNEIVYPRLIFFKDAPIIYVERCDCELCTTLDRESCTDAYIGYIPCALRTQEDGINWRTFTIRAIRTTGSTTEWDKLICPTAFSPPYFHIQSYIGENKTLLGAAIAETEDIVTYIKEHPEYPLFEQNQYGRAKGLMRRVSNAWFFYVPWDRIPILEEINNNQNSIQTKLGVFVE